MPAVPAGGTARFFAEARAGYNPSKPRGTGATMEPDRVTVDVDALRAYLLDYCGTAMFSGFPAALLDVSDISAASPEELIGIAGRLGVDPARFAVGE